MGARGPRAGEIVQALQSAVMRAVREGLPITSRVLARLACVGRRAAAVAVSRMAARGELVAVGRVAYGRGRPLVVYQPAQALRQAAQAAQQALAAVMQGWGMARPALTAQEGAQAPA